MTQQQTSAGQRAPLESRREPFIRWGGKDSSASVSNHAAQTFSALASYVFGALRLNFMLLLGAAPLFVLLAGADDPFSAPPALIGALFLAMPVITIAFCAFRDCPAFRIGAADATASDEDSWWHSYPEQSLLRPGLHVLRTTGWRVLGVTALPMGLALILVIDAQWALGHSWAAVLAPAFLLGAALALVTAFAAAALVSERAEAPWHVLVRIAAFGALRSWPLSLLNLLVLAVALLGMIWQPILSWALASSLVLYVIWAGARWSILPTVRARTS